MPTAIYMKHKVVLTRTGAALQGYTSTWKEQRSCAVSPSCPCSSRPQQKADPSGATAQMWCDPALSVIHRPSFARVGAGTSSSVLWPCSPSAPSPQQYASPPVVSPHDSLFAALTVANVS